MIGIYPTLGYFNVEGEFRKVEYISLSHSLISLSQVVLESLFYFYCKYLNKILIQINQVKLNICQ